MNEYIEIQLLKNKSEKKSKSMEKMTKENKTKDIREKREIEFKIKILTYWKFLFCKYNNNA